MNKSGLAAALAAILVASTLAGCGPASQTSDGGSLGDAPPTSSAPPATTPAATGSPATSDDSTVVLPDGRSPVLLTNIDLTHSQVTFDLIELYLGLNAAVEWKKDHPGETEVPPLNGHYMRNNNPKLRTLPVAAGTKVKLVLRNGNPDAPEVIDFSALPAYDGALHSTFWITVKGGVITLFEEQFFP